MKKWQKATLAAVVLMAVGLGCLFGGRAWGATSSDDSSRDRAAGQTWGDGSRPSGGPGDGSGQFRGPDDINGGNMVTGSIISVDDSGITVKTSDGSTKIILVSGSTSISVTTEGSESDLVTGKNVTVSGTTNTDGTVTASSIRLGDVLGFGGTPGGAPPSGGTPSTGATPSSDGTTPSGSGEPTTQTTATE